MRALENPDPDDVAERVLRALQGIRFGSVEITVHEGRVVQVERREKLRWDRPGGAPAR